MKIRVYLAVTSLAATSAAVATDVLFNPGRWEVTGEIQYGQNRPPGTPASERFSDIRCLANQVGIGAKKARSTTL